jgi:CRP-like cAMP-binding protein
VTALGEVPGLAPLDERTLLQIVGDSANLFWPEGSLVIERGAPSEGLYVVVSGSVRVQDDADRELAVLGPGDYFGEFALLLGTDHQQTVRAATDSELMVVPRERFDALLAESPALGKNIREMAAERQRANLERATGPGWNR